MKIINQILMSKNKCLVLALTALCSFAAPIAAQTYYVTTTANMGLGSLRDAITQVNTSAYNVINFTLSTGDPGYDHTTNTWTFQPNPDLPPITSQVTIDGYAGSPGGAVPNSKAQGQGNDAVLTIVINGSNYTVGDGLSSGNGLHFAAGSDGSIVRGLVINQWLDNGILLDTTNANITGIQINGCFIGTDASGTVEMANRCGIGLGAPSIFSAVNTIIGTSNAADRNIIAGSFGWDIIDVYGLGGGCIATAFDQGTIIQNNYIGTDKSGTLVLGNSQFGFIPFVPFNALIGGNSDERNIIAGHSIAAIALWHGLECTAQNNYVGTDVTGTYALENGNSGIAVFGLNLGLGCTIINNLASGHQVGIRIGDLTQPGCILNTAQGNSVGTDASGTQVLGNARFGVEIDDNQNTVTGNVLSGNTLGGLLIYGQANANSVTANFIGTDTSGTQKLPNQGNGVQIGLNGGLGGAFSNTIGS